MRYLENILKPIIVLLFLAMAVVTFAATLARLIPQLPSFYWAGELTRYLNFWITCLGIAIALRTGQHFTFDLVSERLGPGMQRTFFVARNILMIAFEVVFVYYGYRMFATNFDQMSAAMELPMSYVYVAIPFCGVMMLATTLQTLWCAFRSPRKWGLR